MTTIGVCLMFEERGISTERAYRAFHAERMKRTRRLALPQADPLPVGLDCGMWLAWCHCGAGVGVAPGWTFAACLCGREWSAFLYPDAALLERIDAVLSRRPPGSIHGNPLRFYSWRPDETIRDLVVQNLQRGWPIPEGARSWR